MTMNKDEADRCLAISKQKFEAGNSEAAVKFAKKALALCETDEANEWLAFLTKHGNSTPSSSSSSSSAPASSSADTNLRNRSTASTSATPAAAEDTTPSRPYTPDQVEGIKRIKACKTKGDLYAILGLEKGCTEVEIKKAYRKLALQYHPDKCGAPGTDDAFKAIGHAFAVLGDSDKKDKYDRFGIDPESRGGGGGGAGGGFPGRGFGGGGPFEPEISPEDLFNMFFGDMSGQGLRTHSFTAGPGFRTYQFGGGPRQRFHAQRQQQPTQGTGLLQLLQLLPLIALLAFSLFSNIFSESEPTYAWTKTPSHNIARHTVAKGVPYWVDQRSSVKLTDNDSKRRKLDADIEFQWLRNLRYQCAEEKQRQQYKIAQAKGIWSVDQKKLQAAVNMPLPNCDALHKFEKK
ncbi:hypothetical protein HDV00_012132 [Rhizophlyctis rosea]|nr:hypothetical protein HDV00_012132 [Rhizophlyctis rosea]